MILSIGHKFSPVASLADASVRYQRFRGAKLSSRIREGAVFDEHGDEVARVSGDGRVWAPGLGCRDASKSRMSQIRQSRNAIVA